MKVRFEGVTAIAESRWNIRRDGVDVGAEDDAGFAPGEEEGAAALRDVPGLDARGLQLILEEIRKGALGSAGGVEAEDVQE